MLILNRIVIQLFSFDMPLTSGNAQVINNIFSCKAIHNIEVPINNNIKLWNRFYKARAYVCHNTII